MTADTASPFGPRMIAPGEGKTVMLSGVRFRYKVETAHSAGTLAVMEVEIPAHTLVKPHSHTREDEFSLVLEGTVGVRGLEAYFEELAPVLAERRPAAEYYQLAERYGITIADDRIEELERVHGVKL